MRKLIFLLLLTFAVCGWTHGTTPGLQPPAPAASAGFTVLAASDALDSLSTIDVNDTRLPGFNWYVHGRWPNCTGGCGALGPTAAGCFTLDVDGHVEITCDSTGYNGALSSCAATTGSSFVGSAFAGAKGFYAEITLKSSKDPPLFAFWATATEIIFSNIDGIASEFDFPDVALRLQGIDWQQIAGGGWNNIFDTPNITYGAVGTTYHTYAARFVPSAYNGGTSGVFNFYLDGQEAPTARLTETPPGNLSAAETSHFCMFVGGTNTTGLPITIKNYRLWVHP